MDDPSLSKTGLPTAILRPVAPGRTVSVVLNNLPFSIQPKKTDQLRILSRGGLL